MSGHKPRVLPGPADLRPTPQGLRGPAGRPNHPQIVKLVARAAGPGVSFLSNIFLSCRRGSPQQPPSEASV